MNAIKYPLEEVLSIKQQRVERAEKEVKLRQEELKKEEEKLAEVEAERDKVLKHRNDKLQQLRETLDEGTTSPVIEQMKLYLDVVTEELQEKEEKVNKQKEAVKAAEKRVEEAKEVLRLKRKEAEKLETHRKEWLKEARIEHAREEAKQQDEIGETTFLSQHFKKK